MSDNALLRSLGYQGNKEVPKDLGALFFQKQFGSIDKNKLASFDPLNIFNLLYAGLQDRKKTGLCRTTLPNVVSMSNHPKSFGKTPAGIFW